MMSEASWGCFALRSRTNALAGSICTPDGDTCVAEFLAYDQSEEQLLLCRYAEGSPSPCRATVLHAERQEEGALRRPRQVLLCPQERLFASLELRDGSPRVALWRLVGGAGYALAARVAGTLGARAIAWVPPEAQPRLRATEAAVASAHGALGLSLLLAREVLAVALERRADGSWFAEPRLRLALDFQPGCFSWTADGSQLLVGGLGQMACFSWGSSGALEVLHCLCAGECADVQPLHASAFLCRIDVRAVGTSATTDGLLLPSGQQVQGGVTSGSRLVVELDNPQDAAPKEEPLSRGRASGNALVASGILSAGSTASVGLQLMPQTRHLLPLRCGARPVANAAGAGAASARRLHFGAELEVPGEVLATLPTLAARGPSGCALVAVGSFDGPGARVWALAPPHRWGRPPGEWIALGDAALGGAEGAGRLRLRGLALWPGAAGPQLHAVLVEGGASVLERAAPRELSHCALPLQWPAPATSGLPAPVEQLATGSAAEAAAAAEEGSGTQEPRGHARPSSAALERLTDDVAGVRGELQALREGFDAFRVDFRRLTTAVESLATSLAQRST